MYKYLTSTIILILNIDKAILLVVKRGLPVIALHTYILYILYTIIYSDMWQKYPGDMWHLECRRYVIDDGTIVK